VLCCAAWDRYGSFGAYLESTGFSAQQQARLRQLLTGGESWGAGSAAAATSPGPQ
jgi:hypothetical protein